LIAAQEYGHGLWLINAASGRLEKNFARQSGFQCAAWSPDSARLATGGRKKLTLFDREGEKIWAVNVQAERIDSIAWSPDGKTLASPDGAKVRLTDAKTGKATGSLTADPVHFVDDRRQGLSTVSFSADGSVLAASSGGNAFLWSVGRREKLAAFEVAGALAFHPRKPLLATGGPDQTLRVWQVNIPGN
jgi:WD40 repeat protein